MVSRTRVVPMRKTARRVLMVGAVTAVAIVGRDRAPGRVLPTRRRGDRARCPVRRGSLRRRARHVIGDDHITLLHGEVLGGRDAATIERAVTDMPGVRGVESYVHVRLGAGSTPPSEGRVTGVSPALRDLMDAARNAGATGDHARGAVRAVLAIFADRIPADERNQLFARLPQDVRELAEVPRPHGERLTRPHPVSHLVARSAPSRASNRRTPGRSPRPWWHISVNSSPRRPTTWRVSSPRGSENSGAPPSPADSPTTEAGNVLGKHAGSTTNRRSP